MINKGVKLLNPLGEQATKYPAEGSRGPKL